MQVQTILEFFGPRKTYTIPAYQRPYSWECVGKSDKNNQVNMFWEDMVDAFETDPKKIYFIGPMVLEGEEQSGNNFIVIDGQQRLTTITLLFTAVKCFLSDIKKNRLVEEGNSDQIEADIDAIIEDLNERLFNKARQSTTRSEKKVKIETTGDFDYDEILRGVLDCGEIECSKNKKRDLYDVKILSKDISEYKAVTQERKEIIERYFRNRKFFYEALQARYIPLGTNLLTLTSIGKLTALLDFLVEKVAMVPVIAQEFEDAYKIFEVLNNRGLPLSNKDLLRNFIIREFRNNVQGIDPEKKWSHLETDLKLDNDFIGRYVESTKASKQRSSAFNDLTKKIYRETYQNTQIEAFYTDLEKNLITYRKIIEVEFEGKMRSKVLFLLNAPNPTYTQNLLLALFRNIGDSLPDVMAFLTSYERHVLFIELGGRRFSSAPIFEAIKKLNNGMAKKASEEFALQKNGEKSESERLRSLIEGPIEDNDTAKLLIAKYIWTEDYLSGNDVSDLFLHYDKSTLEHIIPQEISGGTNWKRDFSEGFLKEYTYRLGNMTLLTQSRNSANRNYDFSKKRENYMKTTLYLTRRIAEIECISEADIKKWHQEMVGKICEDLEI